MTAAQQQQAAKNFAAYWKGKGYEKGESQPFWLSLLRDVYGVEHPEQFIQFEEQVHLDHTSFIDGTIPATHVLIEQKGLGKDLNKPIKQSDGALLTPFEQAKRYILELPVSQHPRWVVTCNFNTLQVQKKQHEKKLKLPCSLMKFESAIPPMLLFLKFLQKIDAMYQWSICQKRLSLVINYL